MHEEPKNDKDKESALPLSKLDKAMQGLIGTPKTEVDAEEERERSEKRARKIEPGEG